jgi:hypothetical protein
MLLNQFAELFVIAIAANFLIAYAPLPRDRFLKENAAIRAFWPFCCQQARVVNKVL